MFVVKDTDMARAMVRVRVRVRFLLGLMISYRLPRLYPSDV